MARASRVCPQPGCPAFMPCAEHARPGPRQRGYNRVHDKLRRDWAPRVAAGRVTCWRCREPIKPDEPWDLGHLDGSTAYGGPEHANRCNRAAAGRASHQR